MSEELIYKVAEEINRDLYRSIMAIPAVVSHGLPDSYIHLTFKLEKLQADLRKLHRNNLKIPSEGTVEDWNMKWAEMLEVQKQMCDTLG